MTTTQDVLVRAKRFVMGTRRDLVTTTTGAISDSVTSVAVASATGIAANSIVEINLEQMLVTAVASLTLTVSRGYNATTPAKHASGAFVIVNPTVPMADLLASANAELNSLSSPSNGLYRVAHKDISSSLGRIGYDLGAAAGFITVLAVRYRTSDLGDWKAVTGWQITRDMLTTDFASGISIQFPYGLPGNQTTRVWYKTAFGELTDMAEDVPAKTGLPATATDIVDLGAAIRTVEGREIARADFNAQPQTRRATEVPMGNALQAPSNLRRTRMERIAEEAARLRQQWGPM